MADAEAEAEDTFTGLSNIARFYDSHDWNAARTL